MNASLVHELSDLFLVESDAAPTESERDRLLFTSDDIRDWAERLDDENEAWGMCS